MKITSKDFIFYLRFQYKVLTLLINNNLTTVTNGKVHTKKRNDTVL